MLKAKTLGAESLGHFGELGLYLYKHQNAKVEQEMNPNTVAHWMQLRPKDSYGKLFAFRTP